MIRQKTIHPADTRGSVRLCALVFLSTLFVGAVKADLCPDFSPVPDGKCLEINNWSDFCSAIDESATGSELFLCPFDIKKEDTHETAAIERGLTLRCMRKTEEDAPCIIRGTGTHVRVATSDDTLIQGLSFRESDDYAVHIVSKTEDASKATHTFCHCSLIE